MGKITWYLKQLLPLTYRTRYKENGKQMFTVWKMWLGKSYNIDKFVIGA